MLALAFYLHDLDPYALKLWEGGPIRWYGLSYLAGFLIAYWIVRWIAGSGRSPMRPHLAGDMIIASALGVVLGGRLGYALFYQPALLWTFTSHPPFWDLLAINKGGMASHGGMIGAIVALAWFARRHRLPLGHLLDLGALATTWGFFFGRMANFVNGELYGRGPTDVPWAVKFPQEMAQWDTKRLAELDALIPLLPPEAAPTTYDQLIHHLIAAIQSGNEQVAAAIEPLLMPRHPSQIYEALLEGLLLFAVLAAAWLRPRRPLVISSLFCVVYAVVRIIGEQFREPDAGIGFQWLGLTRGQWLSVGLLIAGLVLLVVAARRHVPPLGGLLMSAQSWGPPTRTPDQPAD